MVCGGKPGCRRPVGTRRAPRAGGPLSTLAVLPFKPLAAEGATSCQWKGYGRQLDRAAVHAAGRCARSARCAAMQARAGSARARASSTWRGLSMARCSGVATNCASPRVAAQQPTGVAAWTRHASTRNSPAFLKCRTRSRRAWQVLAPSLEVFAGVRTRGSRARWQHANTDAYQLYLAAGRHAQDMARRRLCARASRCTGRRWMSTRAMPWPGWGLLKRIGARCLGTDARPSEAFEPAHVADPAAPRPRPGPGRKRVPSRHSGSIGSTSTGRVGARVSGGARDQSERGSALTSVWRALLLNQDRPDEGLRRCA